jgi:(E)-4-hydroxy-3-methylbut-2-enyl-diphosphate synthase
MTRQIDVGGVKLGGGAAVSVQSMTNTDTADVKGTSEQILRLEQAGCDIVRAAVPDMEAAAAIKEIKKRIHIPLVADIHFDYRLAVESVRSGADKIRINPGNIGGADRVKAVVSACRERNIPIRVGVNGGSITREIFERHGGCTPRALCESALSHVKLLEALDFGDIVVSIKASSVPVTVESYREISRLCDYPLHVGVTEAGTVYGGIIKSSVGIGTLLSEGIGDTVRVSLTADPEEEVKAAVAILKALNLRESGVEIISCPTCGRTKIDLISLANEAEKRFSALKGNVKIAVMGCAVNGPGEAREADYGITGGDGVGLIFKKGEIVKKVKYSELLDELEKEITREAISI